MAAVLTAAQIARLVIRGIVLVVKIVDELTSKDPPLTYEQIAARLDQTLNEAHADVGRWDQHLKAGLSERRP